MPRLAAQLRLWLLSEPGCYFWYPVWKNGLHPHIVLCEINGTSPNFLVVNISSTCSDEIKNCHCGRCDPACVLDPKDDPKNLIKKQSYVVYSGCRVITLENIKREFAKDEEIIRGVLEKKMFKRIYEGAFISQNTLRRFKETLGNHPPPVMLQI